MCSSFSSLAVVSLLPTVGQEEIHDHLSIQNHLPLERSRPDPGACTILYQYATENHNTYVDLKYFRGVNLFDDQLGYPVAFFH
jgi:hypothetical protein